MQKQGERSDSLLYDRYAATILAYARSLTSSWQDAEDLTLGVFLTALEHDNLSWLSPKQQLVWLRRVVHNKLIDSYRRPGHPPTIPLEQVVESACRDETLTPEEVVLRREELESLRKAIGTLARTATGPAITLWRGPALCRNRRLTQETRSDGEEVVLT